jgi:DeoR family myo-inositol catabolism operon transcriptional repressor
MEHYIYRCGNVSLENLSEHFGVSINTVRRDVGELLKNGTIRKVYGGVIATPAAELIPISHREEANLDAKKTIARLAAEQIQDNTTLYLDTGTTVSEIVPYLINRQNLTIITNSLRVIEGVSQHPNINLFTLGGFYNGEISGFVGITVIDSLNRLAFDTAVISTTGISLDSGLTIGGYFEDPIKRHVLEHSRKRVILVADSGKFDRTALFSFGDIKDINCIITEKEPPRPYREKFQQLNVEMIYPQDLGAKRNEETD